MGLLDYEEYIKYYKEIEYRSRYEIWYILIILMLDGLV